MPWIHKYLTENITCENILNFDLIHHFICDLKYFQCLNISFYTKLYDLIFS